MAPKDSDQKRLQVQARRMSNELSGLMLAHAYVKVRSAGLAFRLSKLDGVNWTPSLGADPLRLNVEVADGMVRKAWVG